MSHDIYLNEPDSKVTIEFKKKHDRAGGTHISDGTTMAWLNITYNYAVHFYAHIGQKGIRTIYGLTGEESIPILEQAIKRLGDDVNDDYWKPTEGNAKRALIGLLSFAKERPDGIWSGD